MQTQCIRGLCGSHLSGTPCCPPWAAPWHNTVPWAVGLGTTRHRPTPCTSPLPRHPGSSTPIECSIPVILGNSCSTNEGGRRADPPWCWRGGGGGLACVYLARVVPLTDLGREISPRTNKSFGRPLRMWKHTAGTNDVLPGFIIVWTFVIFVTVAVTAEKAAHRQMVQTSRF